MSELTATSRAYLIIDLQNQLTLAPHPDHLIIQPTDCPTITIDQIRNLIRWAHLKPFSKKQKTAIIQPAQKMTHQAQNALLKVLEEPPENTVIILTVDDPDNLLPTVRSRCLLAQEV